MAGLTTENDINLVRNMVKRYMNDSRTMYEAPRKSIPQSRISS